MIQFKQEWFKLAKATAKKLSQLYPHLDQDDVESECMLALTECLKTYGDHVKAEFTTYVVNAMTLAIYTLASNHTTRQEFDLNTMDKPVVDALSPVEVYQQYHSMIKQGYTGHVRGIILWLYVVEGWTMEEIWEGLKLTQKQLRTQWEAIKSAIKGDLS